MTQNRLLPVIRVPGGRNQGHRYHQLLTMAWHRFVLLFFLLFIFIHVVFAALFLAVPGSIQGGDEMLPWWRAFCFSVQTLSTIGYGGLLPAGAYGNTLVAIESFLGLFYVAVLTGCLFARISRPRSHLVFSEKILRYPVHGVPNLVFRVASFLDEPLIDVSAKIYARIYDEEDGVFRLLPLRLTRDHSPTLHLNWVLFHPLEEDSPLADIHVDEWAQREVQIFVNILGQDRIYQQTVHDGFVYRQENVLEGHRFADMVEHQEEQMVLDIRKINHVIELKENA